MFAKNPLSSTIVFNLLAILVSYSQCQSDEGICVMRGICGDTEFGAIPCNNKSEPMVLKQIPQNIRPLSLLEAMCPHLYEKGDPLVCCDEFQLESMFITLYNLAHMGFNHCPSCLKNLEKLFCEMNCSPKQNQFIKVKKIKKNDSGNHLATEIDYYLAQDYSNGIFESCKNVRNFEGIIMDSICGGLKGDNCTVNQWLNEMGAHIQNEGISPFKINFHITSEATVKSGNNLLKPLNVKSLKCSEKPTKEFDACDCHHCPESCPHNQTKRDISSVSRVKRDSETCLMKGICDETAFGSIPCVSNEAPSPISDPIALEQLKEMCPHLAIGTNPSVCCTEEQIIRLNETFEMVSMFLKECPACVRNFEKVICHLSCGNDQHNFMKITKSKPNDSGKQMVSEVQYYVNDDWAKGVYDSCKGVHRLGFNVLNHYCKPYKAQECDHHKFLQFIGGDHNHFGHSPFEINFVFTNDKSVESEGIKYEPAKQSFYKCSENPHTGEGICPCIHCQNSCAPGEERIIQKQLPKFKGKSKRGIQTKINNGDFGNINSQAYKDNLCILDTECRNNSKRRDICVKVREPQPLNDWMSVKTLRDICPHLVQSDNPLVCCDSSLVEEMRTAFDIASKLGLAECPSCLHNLQQLVCYSVCSTKQNQMMRVLNATKRHNYVVIERLQHFIDYNFASTIFESCKYIFGGQTMKMMCGYDNHCTVDKWFDFMGRSVKNGGYFPFQMDIKLTSETNFTINQQIINPLNATAFVCNEAPDQNSNVCGCAHCPQSCQ